MTQRVDFRVYGTPKPQGSKRHVGNGIMVESAGAPLKTWREDVKLAALRERRELDAPLDGPLHLRVLFYLARPQGHSGTGRNEGKLRSSAPPYPHRKPDIDKLLRSTLDAISTAQLWADDARVCDLVAVKRYACDEQPPGAHVSITTMNGATL